MRNLKLTVEYDGTGYCGWQRQSNGISIQELIENRLSRIVQEPVKVIGSGRTDAGVHALGQVAHVHLSNPIALHHILAGINSLLPVDIAVRELEEADPNFHARYDAKSKVYRYRICNRRIRSPLGHRYSWGISYSLDFEAMKEAARYFQGTHDFTSFSAAQTDVRHRTRTVTRMEVATGPDGIIEFIMEADGFLRHMVRTIVGTCVEVGSGKLRSGEVEQILAAKNRALAGPTAPARGLFLQEVKYSL